MKQRSNLLMRVLFCKIQCPSFSSLCKPSRAPHFYTPSPLKLESTENAPNSNPVPSTYVTDDDGGGGSEKVNGADLDENEENDDSSLKSCIRKKVCGKSDGGVEEKKKVQWVDNFGKELVEVKKFESSDAGDSDSELENRTCSCLFL